MARKPRNEEFTTITFKTTENEFSPETLKKIRTFFNAQKSKQITLGLMTQFFIENVGNIDLTSYEGMKALTQSGLGATLQEQLVNVNATPSTTDPVVEKAPKDPIDHLQEPPDIQSQPVVQSTTLAPQPVKKEEPSDSLDREDF